MRRLQATVKIVMLPARPSRSLTDSATGLSTCADWIAECDQGDAFFANSVATGGDVNGDGQADLIVGASDHDNGENNEGRAFGYYGSATGMRVALEADL